MGHQIGFYMVGRDEDSFLDFALREQGMVLFPDVSDTAQAAPLAREAAASAGRSAFLVPKRRAGEIRYGKVPLRESFVLDMHSPAIRFARAGVTDQRVLSRGMLYLNTDVRRPHDLELAYRHLEAWIRRHFRRAPADRVYCGPEAFAWIMKWGARPARSV